MTRSDCGPALRRSRSKQPAPRVRAAWRGAARLRLCLLAGCGALPAMPGHAAPPATPAPGPATATPSAAKKQAAPLQPVDAAPYRGALERLDAAAHAARPKRDALRRLAPPSGALRRQDGETQSVNNTQLQRELARARPDGRLLKRHAEMLAGSVEARRSETDRWQRAGYEPADAGAIVKQLAAGGEITVGPTAWQLWVKSVRDWWSNLRDKISKWILGRGGTASPTRMPRFDPAWIRFFFYSTVFSLLAVIAYLVWRALGGRMVRRGTRAEDRVLEGEDAELLKLPSDELRDRAARFAGQVNYREAVRHRFIATLVRFDERALWRYNTRRTNREHIALLRENAARTSLAPPLEGLARRFDRVRYGNAQASEQDWLRFDADANELEAMPAARAEVGSTANGAAKGARA